MDDTTSAGLDDDRIATAAKRIIRQYRLQQSDQSEESIGSAVLKSPRAPADLPGMRLALDDMSLAIEHIQRLLASREDVFMAALERIERNLARTAGRIDALAEEIARVASQPAIDLAAVMDEQRTMTLAVMREFSNMMELGRALLEEARQVHSEFNAAAGAIAGSGSRPI